MKLVKKLVDYITVLTGGLAQGDGHHNPVKVITPGMPETLRRTAGWKTGHCKIVNG